ncbi:hypothetical protein A5791_20565 [Mycobacterium sp. 852002-51163_SCH5372311]|uniref:hypothetical protein n=1 Tax=Mycobacterium sp. 852002-51163_SCH5372311 TaxID=1834097 RepID=UPI000800EF2E|nr:hypothetical protein [Mycobacterium sp. 852002-51163_SCH5372311]OBF86668.1 hypothetical protein A5791_20565 [Mycobacterium sp. 852002-51163_SCH5372311]
MTTNDPSLNQITSYMRQHQADPQNLQFSQAKQQEYVGRINNLGMVLRDNLTKIHGVDDWQVGLFTSALQTKTNLSADVKDIQSLVNGYLGFVSAFAEAVQAAGHNIQTTDQP